MICRPNVNHPDLFDPDEVSADAEDAEGRGVAVLVDFDNVVLGEIPDPQRLSSILDRMVGLVLDLWPDAPRIDIRLYGGWLADGVLTRRASELQAAVASAPLFPFPHPRAGGLLRGSVVLTTRLSAVPQIEWANTTQERHGLPYLSFRDGAYPLSCVLRSQACPLRAMRNFSRSSQQVCQVGECPVTNVNAFRSREQKMVDVMMACDLIDYTMRGNRVLMLSSDADVLPAIAMAASFRGADIGVLRVDRYNDDYDADLKRLGVRVGTWEGA